MSLAPTGHETIGIGRGADHSRSRLGVRWTPGAASPEGRLRGSGRDSTGRPAVPEVHRGGAGRGVDAVLVPHRHGQMHELCARRAPLSRSPSPPAVRVSPLKLSPRNWHAKSTIAAGVAEPGLRGHCGGRRSAGCPCRTPPSARRPRRVGVVHVDRDELVVDGRVAVPVGEVRRADERGDLLARPSMLAKSTGAPWPTTYSSVQHKLSPRNAFRGPDGAPRPRDLRQRSARDGAARSLGALHRSGLRPRRARGLSEMPARHAGAGEEPRDAAARVRSGRRASTGARPGGSQEHDNVYAESEARGLGRRLPDRRHGRRGPRPRRAVPVARAVRARPRLGRADRRRRARAGVRHRHRPGLQRLDEGLLRPRAGPHVRRRDGRAPRRERRGRGGPPLRARSSASRRSSCRRARSTAGRGTTRPTTRCGPRSSGSTCRSRSTAAARPTSRPTSRCEVLDKLMLWHTLQPAARHPVRHGVPVRRRRARALPRPAGGPARGQLLVGAVVPLPPRRALGVDRLVRGPRADHAAVGVLPAQLLDLGRGRRGDRAPLHRAGSATSELVFSTDYPHGDSKYPARRGRLRQAAHDRGDARPGSSAPTGPTSTRSRW